MLGSKPPGWRVDNAVADPEGPCPPSIFLPLLAWVLSILAWVLSILAWVLSILAWVRRPGRPG
jgi:hypothetical protein